MNRRLALRLYRQDVAKELGVWAPTYCLWESDQTEPKIRHMPAVIEFLGFCPIDPNDTPGQRLARARYCLGLGQKRMARMIGIDPNVIWRLETEVWGGREEYLSKILEFLRAEAQRRAVKAR